MSSLPKSLAVSLSGGGHRATLFVLGALMYLVDEGQCKCDFDHISLWRLADERDGGSNAQFPKIS